MLQARTGLFRLRNDAFFRKLVGESESVTRRHCPSSIRFAEVVTMHVTQGATEKAERLRFRYIAGQLPYGRRAVGLSSISLFVLFQMRPRVEWHGLKCMERSPLLQEGLLKLFEPRRRSPVGRRAPFATGRETSPGRELGPIRQSGAFKLAEAEEARQKYL